MSSPVDTIKDRLRIADVISSYIKLEKAGRNLKARCPFHNEKTPSFFVSPERDSFHCFGCQKGGDIFTFIEEIEGVDFKDALRILGERAGVSIEQGVGETGGERTRLIDIMEHAVFYFEKELSHNPRVLSYLSGRGLTEKTIRNFRVGFAPNEWRGIYLFLSQKGFSERELEKVGLVVKSGERVYDRFRGRIMFPIANSLGKTVAFSGRIYEEGDEKTSQAKYINSPETLLYNKSRVLYAFDKAKMEIRQEGFCIIVEGQMDVLMSHQSGFNNTVAVSGTALTEEQLSLISRITENIVLAFDADIAGFTASKRGIDLALSKGFNVKVAKIPKDTDPADLIRKESDVWREAVRKAKHVIDFLIAVLGEAGYDTRVFRMKVGEVVLPYIAHMRNKIDQAHFVSEISSVLNLNEAPIWDEVKRIQETTQSHNTYDFGEGEEKKNILRKSGKEKVEEKIAGLLFFAEKSNFPAGRLSEIKEEFSGVLDQPIIEFYKSIPRENLEAIFFEAEAQYTSHESIEKELCELLYNLKTSALRGRLRKVMNDLKYAETKKDENLVSAKLKECSEISKEIEKLSAHFPKTQL